MATGEPSSKGATVNPCEFYRHILYDTDPSDPVVQQEINKGLRQSDGMTDIQHHLRRLSAAAEGNVLEIGVRFGVSTSALLYGIEERAGHVWSIDRENTNVFPNWPRWTFLKFDSIRDSEYLLDYLPAHLDLLFIDGDHSFDSVLADLRNYGPRSSTIMLHDTYFDSVYDAISKYMRDARQKSWHGYGESHGLAVLE